MYQNHHTSWNHTYICTTYFFFSLSLCVSFCMFPCNREHLLTNNSLALPGILVQLRYYAFFQYFLFFCYNTTYLQAFYPPGVPRAPWHPQILADQLTLSQPVEGRLCPPNNTGFPQISGLPKALIWYSVVIWLACNYWLCIALGAKTLRNFSYEVSLSFFY